MNTWLTAFNDTVIHPKRDKVFRRVAFAIDIALFVIMAVVLVATASSSGVVYNAINALLVAFWAYMIYADPIRWARQDAAWDSLGKIIAAHVARATKGGGQR